RRPLLRRHLPPRVAARRAGRRVYRADGIGRPGTWRRRDRAVLRGSGDRRPRQPARGGAGRGDRRHGALGVGALPAAARAVRHLLRHGGGARSAPARSLQPRGATKDMTRDRTLAVVVASFVVLAIVGP